MVKTMIACFEWPTLWVFPLCLLILSFLFALASIIGFRKKEFSMPGLIIIASASALCLAVGIRYCVIANSPKLTTEKVTYQGESIERLSFSKKYLFVSENGEKMLLRFPYFVSQKTIMKEELLPENQYSITYECNEDIIVVVKKENASASSSTEKIITNTYAEKDSQYSTLSSILNDSIFPFSLAGIALIAMILFGINADTKRERALILLLGLPIIMFSTSRGIHYIKIVNHPVIVETKTYLVAVNEELASDWIEMDFVDEAGNRLEFSPKRNTFESYLGVEELEHGDYWLVYEAQSNTLLDIRKNL